MKNILLIVICGFLLSCSNREKNNLDIAEKSISIDLNKSSVDKLSSLFEEVEYVLLESDTVNFLVDPYKVKLYDSLIFVTDDFYNSLFIFERDGKFRTRINSTGTGPTEFFTLEDFSILNDTVWVRDGLLRKELAFDLNGKFIFEKKSPFQRSMFYKSNNFSLYYLNNDPEYDFRIVRISDSTPIPFIHRPSSLIRGMTSDPIGFQKDSNGSIYFSLPDSYNILKFSSDGMLEENFKLDFGQYEFKESDREKLANKIDQYEYAEENNLVINFGNFITTNDGFLVYLRRNGLSKDYLFFDRNFNLTKQGKNIINDIDGLNFKEMPWTTDGKNIIYRMNSIDFKNYVKNKDAKFDSNQNIRKIMSSYNVLNNNESHILAFFKPKKDLFQ